MGFEVFNYEVVGQISLFDLINDKSIYKINKKVKLIETFAEYGSQALALKRLGIDFEHHKISEWCISSNRLYKAAHFPNKKEESKLTKQQAIEQLLI